MTNSLTSDEHEERLKQIRERSESRTRVSAKFEWARVGVQEWADIDFLLSLVDSHAPVAAPLRKLYSELIHIAAALVRADGFLSPCEEDLEPRLRRASILQTARTQDERLKDWAMRVRRVADELSPAIAAPQGDAFTAYNQAIEDALAAIREESQGGGYWAATFINAIARKCSPHVYVNSLSPIAPSPIPEQPINMILFCPRCGTQHVDAPEDETTFRHRMEAFSLNAEWQDRAPSRWTNPPHKSHLCHNCYAVWRPADVPTNGVAQITTRGKEDNTWTNSAAVPGSPVTPPSDVARKAAEAAAKDIIELLLMTEREELPRKADIAAIISRHLAVPVVEGEEDFEFDQRCYYCRNKCCHNARAHTAAVSEHG